MLNFCKFFSANLMFAGAMLLLGMPTLHAGEPTFPRMLVEHLSPLGFDETVDKLEANAKALGWKVPSKWKINFQKNLKRVTGKDIGKNEVLKMCAPDAAVPLLMKDEYKMLTAMMPCTIAVYEKSDGKTYIAMMNLHVMGQMYGAEVADMAAKLQPQMDKMLELQ